MGNISSPYGQQNKDKQAQIDSWYEKQGQVNPHKPKPAAAPAASAPAPIALAAGPRGGRVMTEHEIRDPSASTTSAVGNMSEWDAIGLHDRYSGSGALAAYRGQRSPETASLIQSSMQQAQGLNAAENSAIRNNALSSINSQNQAALRSMRGSQAASGVRGGLAQAQLGQQQAQATSALADAERNLVADNIKYKQAGLANAAQVVSNQENVERDMGADKLGTVLAARAENAGLSAAQMQAQAAAAGGGGGGGKK